MTEQGRSIFALGAAAIALAAAGVGLWNARRHARSPSPPNHVATDAGDESPTLEGDRRFELTEVDLALDPLARFVSRHPAGIEIEGEGPNDVPHAAFIEVWGWGRAGSPNSPQFHDTDPHAKARLLAWLGEVPVPPERRWAVGRYEGDYGYGWQSRLVATRSLVRATDVTGVERDPGAGSGCGLRLKMLPEAARRMEQFSREHPEGWIAALVRGDVDAVERTETVGNTVRVRFSRYSTEKCQDVIEILTRAETG